MTSDERIAELERRAGDFDRSVRRLDERISENAGYWIAAVERIDEAVIADRRTMRNVILLLALVSLVEAVAIAWLWWRG